MNQGGVCLVTNEVSAVVEKDKGSQDRSYWSGAASAALVKPCAGHLIFKNVHKSIRLRKAPHSRAKRKAGVCKGKAGEEASGEGLGGKGKGESASSVGAGGTGSGGSGVGSGKLQTTMEMMAIESESPFDITAAGIVEITDSGSTE